MTSLPRAAAGWILVGCASSAACALVGYDFGDYGPSGAGGSGGYDATTSQASGSGSPASSGAFTSSSVSGGSFAAATSGSGGSKPCLDVADCDDMNACTTEVCSSGQCGYVPVATPDDGNACTADGCEPSTGQATHTPIPNCCPHSACTVGGPLNGACTFAGAPIDCVPEICGTYPQCCAMGWTVECVDQAKASCGTTASITCACAHSYCVAGSALVSNCDPCVEAVCKISPSCCMTAWDDLCVAATHMLCHVPLGANCQ